MKDTAELFRVLADESRLKMLWLLLYHRELCVCDFMEVLRITQSKASRHLRILYRAGILNDRRDGLWVHYALRPVQPEPVKSHLAALREHLSRSAEAAVLLERLETWKGGSGSGTRRIRRSVCGPVSAAAGGGASAEDRSTRDRDCGSDAGSGQPER